MNENAQSPDREEIQRMVMDLANRAIQDALKDAGVGRGITGGESSPKDRMKRERDERKVAQDLKNFRPSSEGIQRGARPTNPKRQEELQRSYSQLNAPTPVPKTERTETSEAAGDAIEVVVVDNGEFKTGNFYIKGALVAV